MGRQKSRSGTFLGTNRTKGKYLYTFGPVKEKSVLDASPCYNYKASFRPYI